MSLDVYLEVDTPQQKPGSGIFVREGGKRVEITREEWDEKFPGREPVVAAGNEYASTTVYNANITHNLTRMAKEAAIYMILWRPEEIGIERAADLVDPLASGLRELRSRPDHYKQFNPENGWGDYDGLVEFVEEYRKSCRRHPDAAVRTSR